MKIQIDDIKESPKAVSYTEAVEELNSLLARGAHDFSVPGGLGVDLEHYRAGLDILLQGKIEGEVVGVCGRCLEDYTFAVERPFRIVLEPRSAAPRGGGRVPRDELELDYYDGKEIDTTPHIYEELLLALPTRALCGEDCRGLCVRCGANLNTGPCGCSVSASQSAPATTRRGR